MTFNYNNYDVDLKTNTVTYCFWNNSSKCEKCPYYKDNQCKHPIPINNLTKEK